MSELEKIIDMRLADARKCSSAEQTISSDNKNDTKQKSEEHEATDAKSPNIGIHNLNSKNSNSHSTELEATGNPNEQSKSKNLSATKPERQGLDKDSKKNDGKKSSSKSTATTSRSKTSISDKNDARKDSIIKSSDSASKNPSKSENSKKKSDKPDVKNSGNRTSSNTNSTNANKTTTAKSVTKAKNTNSSKTSTGKSVSNTNGENDNAKSGFASKKDENKAGKSSNANVKAPADEDRKSKHSSKDTTKADKNEISNDKECKKNTKIETKSDVKKGKKSKESTSGREQSKGSSRDRSHSRVNHDRSRSPRIRSTKTSYITSSSRYSRHYSPIRSPMRKRSLTPVRGSYRDTLRRQSPSRRYDRSRSPINSKSLIAKKSFLDELAVKFAQEGKEFPELEQYRCEINSQFISYPSPYCDERSMQRSFPGKFDDPIFPMMDNGPPVAVDPLMNVGPPMDVRPMMFDTQFDPPRFEFAPVMLPEPVINVPPMISYPIPGMQQMMDSSNINDHSRDEMLAINPCMGNKVVVADVRTTTPSVLGSQPLKKCTKGEVKNHVIQALDLLDELGLTVSRTAKFLYRTPTFYENEMYVNRSPVVQSRTNPLFMFSSRCGESSDPFGNIPRKLKPIIDLLSLDEGVISKRIFLRDQKTAESALRYREKLELEERQKRLLPKLTLQKNTQTDPTVCKECLLRMIKVKVNCETQTCSVHSIESATQTNPMPLQTVSEFGSITELTPNQVRAVSELIKYIKLTVTSGSLTEMRDSMRDDQVYNLNSDLRTAYQYFDEMVEQRNSAVLPPMRNKAPGLNSNEVADNEDDIVNTTSISITGQLNEEDEYEQYHRAFCEGEPDAESGDHHDDYNQDMYNDEQDDDDLRRFQHIPQVSHQAFGYNSNSMTSSYGISSPRSSGGNFSAPHQSNLSRYHQASGYNSGYHRRGHTFINRRN